MQIPDHSAAHVREVQAISAVPHILETVAALTGLGYVAIAHVTEHSWEACAVIDRLDFGLGVGGKLYVSSTLCDEVRSSGEAIVIDCVRDSDAYREHHTPRLYGFQSYFSVPIIRPDGRYFGTLCGLDPEPRALSAPAIGSTLSLFAQLISQQLEAERTHADTKTALLSERETAELREQFIAVLGHDLRTPLGAIQMSIDLLRRQGGAPTLSPILDRMARSVGRMASIVDDTVDFTRGRMGDGIGLTLAWEANVDRVLRQAADELRSIHAGHPIELDIASGIALHCDAGRMGQLASNLIKNAIVHGAPGAPVRVSARLDDARFVLAVANRGDHLAPEVVAQLFKPFRRGVVNGAHDGLGLGLYIVDEIARAHGGAMEVVSRDGVNSFVFSMPVGGA